MPDSFVDAGAGVFCVVGEVKTGFVSSMFPKLRTLSSIDSKPAAVVVSIVIIQCPSQWLNNIGMQNQGDDDSSILLS